MVRVIQVIVCGRDRGKSLKRCVKSIGMQSFAGYETHISVDDDDANRKYLVRNTWETVAAIRGTDDDILVFLDADDFFIDEDALRIVADTYAKYPDCLVTYGNYVNYHTNKRGKFTGEYKPEEAVRTAPWRASHLKTCRMKLWKHLPVEHLKWPDGSWFKCAADRAFMIPLMEMAGWDRCRHIDWLLYCYNDENPESVWNTMREESVRTREHIAKLPALKRLDIA